MYIFNLFAAITLVGLLYLPKKLKLWDPHIDVDDENSQLLKQMTGYKKRRNMNKKTTWSNENDCNV